jgi:hypothetical protein
MVKNELSEFQYQLYINLVTGVTVPSEIETGEIERLVKQLTGLRDDAQDKRLESYGLTRVSSL